MARPARHDRETLVATARDLFWRQGWAGTSLKDLERALDMRPGSFYAAFGSKDRLYALALDRYAADGAARLEDLRARHGPLGALKAHLHALASDPAPARACMLVKTLLEAPEGPLSDHAAAALTAMEARFEALFRAAQEAGEIAPHHDPARLARRHQSDVTGLRATVERPDIDGPALAAEMAAGLDALAEPS
ncbi:TetR/AcrR family transcriptional regulator [uncultured Jannaschia sp.]|uniref:TetR/AcrR family transcriptional regulator n=1 Tax=uncultured Jannaschia sp. TaxID=293347 RepID=UPI002621FC69|nr:TetR/AcrR family transcriptional regulator [uncultured Jannaschia sp.]